MATDPLAEIQKYIDTVTAVRNELQEAGDTVGKQSSRLDDIASSIEDKAGGLVQDVEDFCGETHQQEWGEVKQQLEAWTGNLGEMANKELASGMQYLEQQESESHEVLSSLEQGLKQDFQELTSQGFDQVDEGQSALETEVGDLTKMAEDAFKALGAGIEGLESSLDEVESTTLDRFSTMSSELTGAMTGAMDQAFEQLSTGISDEALNDISEGFGDLGSQLSGMFSDFGDSVEAVATGLVGQGAEIFSSMVTHATEEAAKKIGEEVAEAVQEFIEALIQEFIESAIEMAVGAATTSALAQFVPALAAAKAICGTINDLLEIMNMGL